MKKDEFHDQCELFHTKVITLIKEHLDQGYIGGEGVDNENLLVAANVLHTTSMNLIMAWGTSHGMSIEASALRMQNFVTDEAQRHVDKFKGVTSEEDILRNMDTETLRRVKALIKDLTNTYAEH